MAAHPSPQTVHLHLHAVHAPARLSWLATVAVVVAVVLVLLAVVLTGDGTILSPDQLPQPRHLTSLVP
jgi:hypothetical protein